MARKYPNGRDAVMYASGRLSHAIRTNQPQEIIEARRRELADAQMERDIKARLASGPPPSRAKVAELCKILRAAAAA